MHYTALFFTFGVWLLQQQAVLPNLAWSGLILLFGTVLILPRNSLLRRKAYPVSLAALACTLGFFYAAFFAQQRLSDTLPAEWQGKDIQIIGVVGNLPVQNEHGLRFVFDVEQVLTPNATVPPHILLANYANAQEELLDIHAGERWRFTVRLKQPHGNSNPHDFDFEAWMLENKLRANGYIHQTPDNSRLDPLVQSPGYTIQSLREHVRTRIRKALNPSPDQPHSVQVPHAINEPLGHNTTAPSVIKKNNYTGVLTALAIGDQTGIPAAQWQIFTRTSVNHLISISGLHITMLSGLAFAASYWLWRRSARLTRALPARKAAALIGLLAALGYALLAGYGVPAQRTVYMLATIASVLWLSRTVAPSQTLAALLVVLLLDPWAVLSPGFWLSFGAVALIFYVTAHRLPPPALANYL